jgi:hypothetical protein
MRCAFSRLDIGSWILSLSIFSLLGLGAAVRFNNMKTLDAHLPFFHVNDDVFLLLGCSSPTMTTIFMMMNDAISRTPIQ